ncbi:MAG: methyltransferase domain-containing protein [Acidobacteriaceae bacterium]
MERLVEEEWLDQEHCTLSEVKLALRSIRSVNRRFGGDRLHARLLARALTRVDGAQRPHILEVASGEAEVLRTALLKLEISADVTLLDRLAEHLPEAEAWLPPLAAPRLVPGDALNLPFPDTSVDIVSCCLFLHHLEPPQVMRFLAEAQRVARVAIIINDLERIAIHYRLAQLKSLSDPSRISRHDGPVSVRRAYTFRELERMLANTGRSFVLERAWLCRLGAVLWCGDASVESASL